MIAARSRIDGESSAIEDAAEQAQARVLMLSHAVGVPVDPSAGDLDTGGGDLRVTVGAAV